MELSLTTANRRLLWPPLVEYLREVADNPDQIYLVGGSVRDALSGRRGHDIDLVTMLSGLDVARQIANALDGAYYPIDPDRKTGRALVHYDDRDYIIDVASLRGDDLLADLRARDFTINAIASPLTALDRIYDPLDGLDDLFQKRIMKQCSSDSIQSDPIRALRAIRQSLELKLRFDKDVVAGCKAAGPSLVGDTGKLIQPERTRDELFKILSGPRPAGGLRLLHTLNLLEKVVPFELPVEALGEAFILTESLDNLIFAISPQRSDNSASQLVLGLAVMILDRNRSQLQEYLGYVYGDARARATLLLTAAFSLPISTDFSIWVNWLNLSNKEADFLNRLHAGQGLNLFSAPPPSDRDLHRFFQITGDAGPASALLNLAAYLAANRTRMDSEIWGNLLESYAAPINNAYFNRYEEVITPVPLLTGDELMHQFKLKPGKVIGDLIRQLTEAQAAGEVRTREEALRLIERLLKN